MQAQRHRAGPRSGRSERSAWSAGSGRRARTRSRSRPVLPVRPPVPQWEPVQQQQSPVQLRGSGRRPPQRRPPPAWRVLPSPEWPRCWPLAAPWAPSSRGQSRRCLRTRQHPPGAEAVPEERHPQGSAGRAPRCPGSPAASGSRVAGVRLLAVPHRAPCNISSPTEQGCHRGYRLMPDVLCGHHFGAGGCAG